MMNPPAQDSGFSVIPQLGSSFDIFLCPAEWLLLALACSNPHNQGTQPCWMAGQALITILTDKTIQACLSCSPVRSYMKVTSMTELSTFRHGIPTQATVSENFEMMILSKSSSLEYEPRSLTIISYFEYKVNGIYRDDPRTLKMYFLVSKFINRSKVL